MTYFIGIDPGLTGALAVLNEAGELVLCEDMPVEQRNKNGSKHRIATQELGKIVGGIMEQWGGECVAVLERVAARPGQGVVSMFSFGDSFGSVRGVLGAHKVRTHEVVPEVWKRSFGLLGCSKDGSRLAAATLYPAASVRRVKDHGRADAILLARWGWNQRVQLVG